MYEQAISSIFGMNNFFDELCIIDQDEVIQFYQVCPSDAYAFTVDQVIGKRISEVFPMLTVETNEILQALQERKAICTFHDYCLTYKGDAYPGYVSVFPIYQKKRFVAVAVALKYITPDYQKQFIQIQDNAVQKKLYASNYTLDDIITIDPTMDKIKDKIRKVSDKDSSVLIEGRTGTGKELVAQSLHYSSQRATGPFISQNCSAIPDNLLESTLFGTEKGSFTGAITNKGLFELADGGTLFLDEINSMELSLQGKILKSIESKSVRHLGGHEDIKVNVRIVAAINENPFEAMEHHRLRSDLFYRLNVIFFHLPDLTERPRDITYLTDYYIDYYNESFDMRIKGLDAKAEILFASHSWPGNVRELRNIIEGAFAVVEGDYITAEDLPEYLQFSAKKGTHQNLSLKPQSYASFLKQLKELEADFLEKTITSCGTKAAAAKQLGITKQTLNYKLNKLYDR